MNSESNIIQYLQVAKKMNIKRLYYWYEID